MKVIYIPKKHLKDVKTFRSFKEVPTNLADGDLYVVVKTRPIQSPKKSTKTNK